MDIEFTKICVYPIGVDCISIMPDLDLKSSLEASEIAK